MHLINEYDRWMAFEILPVAKFCDFFFDSLLPYLPQIKFSAFYWPFYWFLVFCHMTSWLLWNLGFVFNSRCSLFLFSTHQPDFAIIYIVLWWEFQGFFGHFPGLFLAFLGLYFYLLWLFNFQLNKLFITFAHTAIDSAHNSKPEEFSSFPCRFVIIIVH